MFVGNITYSSSVLVFCNVFLIHLLFIRVFIRFVRNITYSSSVFVFCNVSLIRLFGFLIDL